MAKKTEPSKSPDAQWVSDKTHISLRVTAGQKFRAGAKITQSPTILAKADLSPGQAWAILMDRELIVEEIDAPDCGRNGLEEQKEQDGKKERKD